MGHHNGLRLLLVFVALLLPLWGFARLAGDLHAGAVIAFDEPLLRWLHSLASPGRDRFFSVVTDLGYLYGVVPVDIALIAVLFARRRLHAATFASIALVGSAFDPTRGFFGKMFALARFSDGDRIFSNGFEAF